MKFQSADDLRRSKGSGILPDRRNADSDWSAIESGRVSQIASSHGSKPDRLRRDGLPRPI